MDDTGGPEFTVNVWISTFQTLFAEIMLMFRTEVWGFQSRMVFTFSHLQYDLKRNRIADQFTQIFSQKI